MPDVIKYSKTDTHKHYIQNDNYKRTEYYSAFGIGTGLWTGLFFGISGGVGLVALQRPSNCR